MFFRWILFYIHEFWGFYIQCTMLDHVKFLSSLLHILKGNFTGH